MRAQRLVGGLDTDRGHLYIISYKCPEAHVSSNRPSQDIRPLSEFRASVATFVEQVRTTQRPLVLTQHGRSAAILLAVDAYEALVERAELSDDVHVAERQIAAGQGVPHTRALAQVRAKLRGATKAPRRPT